MLRSRSASSSILVILLLSVGCAAPAVAGDREISFDQILDGSVRFGERGARGRFDSKGEAVAVGREWTSVATGESTLPSEGDSNAPAADNRLNSVSWPDRPDDPLRFPRRGRQYSSDGRVVAAATREGILYRTADSAEGRFVEDRGAHEIFTISPAGTHVSWVRKNDLYTMALPSGSVNRLSTGGSPDLFHGKLDWVYQEEVYGRGNFRGHWWSPAGGHLAYLTLDETNVPTFQIVDHVPARQRSTAMRYPKAGDPNPVVSVSVYSVARDTTIEVDLSEYGAGDTFLVVRVGWSPDGSRLLLQIQDRIQTWLDLLSVDPATGESKRILREESETWVNVLGTPRWLEDGERFLWFSERTGFRHVYLVDGDRVEAVTQGDWEVRRILEVDESRGEIWFQASIPSAVESHAYRVSLHGGVIEQLTSDPGTHAITIAPDREHFLDAYSSHDDPGELRLCDRNGRIIRVLAENRVSALEEYAYSVPERVEIPARDGVLLDGMIYRPTPFDARRSYPVWLMTYSGPDAPTVRDRWSGDAWKQFLCQQGIIILQVNNRSSSGRGQVDTATCYRRLGEGELRDLEDAVAWLTREPWADAERVGITGWSYGGFMAAYALTHSKAFSLGIAGAGVYDWRLYDTIYTERYMQTPEQNPDGYRETSVIENAAGLSGHLLLVHGMDDDNVHVQNTMQLARALQKAGKQFDLMVYPTAMHGIRDREQRRHHRTLEWRTIRSYLLGLPPERKLSESNLEAGAPASGTR